LNKINVFGDDHSVHLASLLENLRILSREETKILNVDGFLVKVSQPSGESWWELGIDPHLEG